MNPFGYVLYLLVVFVPGLGLGEFLGVWKDRESLTEILGYATGLGFAADTCVLFLGSSGLVVGNAPLLGVTMNKFYLLMSGGLALFAVSIVRRRGIPHYPKPTRSDFAVWLLMVAQVCLVLLFFAKYPIFPEYNSVDFRSHLDIVTTLLSSGSSVPNGILYFGVHYQLALGVLLTGGSTLETAQRVAGILAVLGTPLVFFASSRILSNRNAGLIASSLYALTASIWFGGLFNTGLYPNFFGVFASLFVLAILLVTAKDGLSPGALVALVVGTGWLYLSHYSDVSVIPAVLVVPVGLLLQRKLGWKKMIPPAVVLLPAALGALALPSLVSTLVGFVQQAGGTVSGGTYLSGLLSPLPVLASMATETYYDVGFVLLLLLSLAFAYRVLRSRELTSLVPVVWFLSVLAVAPFNPGAWRLAYVGLVPLLLMASGGLAALMQEPQRGRRSSQYRDERRVTIGFFLIVLVAGSWGVTIISDSTSGVQTMSQSQQDVLTAMIWIGNNTKAGSILSVSDFRFLYSPEVINRNAAYRFISYPAEAVAAARSGGFTYIVVTQLVTANVPPIPQLFPWNNFPTQSGDNLTLLYFNPDVRVYQVS